MWLIYIHYDSITNWCLAWLVLIILNSKLVHAICVDLLYVYMFVFSSARVLNDLSTEHLVQLVARVYGLSV